MKKHLIYILGVWALFAASCYKDKGNYTYHIPPAPVLKNFDTVYSAIVGDSLIIAPTVTIDGPDRKLGFEWKIAVPEEMRGLEFHGPAIRTVFGLKPSRYFGRLTIIDSSNGMKYFYDFAVDGKTVFATGTTVLSNESGKSQISFISPDGTVLPRLYGAINNGEELPGAPQQVVAMLNQYIVPTVINSYWFFFGDGADRGIQIDANTFKKIKTLRGNFFDPPAVPVAGTFFNSPNGVLEGVINGKLYVGATQTWSGSPVYGMFGQAADGDYTMFREGIFNTVMPYFVGYDVNRRQFLSFTNFGSPAYAGNAYPVTDTTAFDPRNVRLDLWHLEQINNNNCYAFGKGANDTIFRLKFGVNFIGVTQFAPMEKKPFPRQDLVSVNTKWTSSPTEIFYFTSGSQIYRYNPLNEEVKVLTTDFGGKAVSMIKAIDDGNTLIAGVEGALYFLDVSTGRFGDIKRKIDGIPGTPVDAVVK
jgi:hypothetical protein